MRKTAQLNTINLVHNNIYISDFIKGPSVSIYGVYNLASKDQVKKNVCIGLS